MGKTQKKLRDTSRAPKFNCFENSSRCDNSFRNTKSVFDILKDNNYELRNIQGIGGNFAAQNDLFQAHGFSVLKDGDYFKSQGYNINEHRGIWGFGDKFVLNRAIDEINELNDINKPYCLFVQLIDSHVTDYFPFESHYNDIRDNIIHVDKQLGEFVKSIEKMDLKNTAAMLMGDHHIWAMNANDLPKERSLYTIFLGDIKKVSEERKNERFCAVDVAPTILDLAGATWEHNGFGIGTSMLGSEKSLAGKLGINELNKEISRFSPYYRKLM